MVTGSAMQAVKKLFGSRRARASAMGRSADVARIVELTAILAEERRAFTDRKKQVSTYSDSLIRWTNGDQRGPRLVA